MPSVSKIQSEIPNLEPTYANGSLSSRKVYYPRIQKTLLVALVILGIASLGIAIGIGTTGLVSIHSITFISLTSLSGTAFLLAGIDLILLKERDEKRVMQRIMKRDY